MNTPKACGHTGCQLRTREGCCACLDRRPVQASYMQYIDGQGWQAGSSRQAMYCPHCHVNYPPAVAPANRHPPHQTVYRQPPVRTQYPAPTSPAPLSSQPPLSSPPPLSTDTNTCIICFDARLEALLLPCAHLCSCASCTVRLFREHPATKENAEEWEVNGHELLAQTVPGRYGQIGFDALDRLGAPNPVECPLCRTGVRGWIKVYT